MSHVWDPIVTARGGKASADDKSAEAVNVETPEEITQRVRAEEQQRAIAIVSACDLAGASSQAADLILSGKTVGEVVAALSTQPTSLATSRHQARLARMK